MGEVGAGGGSGAMMVQGQQIIFDVDDSGKLDMFNYLKLEKTKGFVAGYKECKIDGVGGYLCKIYLHKFLTGSKYVRWLNGNKFDFRKSNMIPVDRPFHTGPICGAYVKGNEYRKEKGKVVILIARKGVIHESFIDHEDLPLTSRYTWNIDTQGYACSKEHLGRGSNIRVYMHRLLMGVKNPKDIVDHINGNRLDNRKENLRICSYSQNCHNKPSHQGKVKGVYKFRNIWSARIAVNGIRKQKYFKNYDDAIRQRQKWDEEYDPSGLNKKKADNDANS